MHGFYTAKVGKYPGLRLPESGFYEKSRPRRRIKSLFTIFVTKQIPTMPTTYPGELPDNLQELAELMARDTHETWAAAQIARGWTYGPVRSDGAKKHPCLTPYETLPESERENDRNAAAAILRQILGFGYKIEKE